MNLDLDFFDRRRAERFAQLLDETNGGLRHHARGQADDQLAELVAIGHTLSAVRPAVQVDTEFRTGLRAMLVATAERDGIGEPTPTETAPGVHAAIREPRGRGLLGKVAGRRVRARGAIVLGVAAGALAVSGISAASENAVPGDALYGVKRSTERAQLAMAGSDVTRGQLSLNFARNRLAEAAALDGSDPGFGDVLDDMDTDTRQGVSLLHKSAVTRKDKAPLDAVDAFTAGQRRLIGPVLDELSAGNQQRALASMALLDLVDRRADALRTALNCDSDVTTDDDSLGPKPRPCLSGSDSIGPADEQEDRSGTADEQKTSTGRTPSKVDPTASRSAAPAATADDGTPVTGGDDGAPSAPLDAPATTDPAEPSASKEPAAPLPPEPVPAPTEEPEDRGLLGGLIGILGG